jgi:O-antigen/teichoic acid export membrane protein
VLARAKSKLRKLPKHSSVLHELRNPLLRNGHLLTLSSALTAIVGFGYWTVAAWKYDPATVGINSAAISMMIMVASIAQLNLWSAAVRFVPIAGRRTTQLVAGVYLLSGCVALLVGVCSVALVRLVSPGAKFLDGTLSCAMFVFAAIAYTIFVIQDGVLAALHRTLLVPLGNFVFGVLKVGLVVVLAATMPRRGIFASWALSLGCIVLAISIFLFGWAIPRHQRRAADTLDTMPPVRQLVRFVAFDYIGEICLVGSHTVLPMLVFALLGAEQNAYFAMAWLIAYSAHLIGHNMGISLVVESAGDQSHLARQVRHILTHSSKLLVLVVLALIVSAPYLLGVFGNSYRDADNTLRLLALAALPNLLLTTAVSSARARRRMGLVVYTEATLCFLTLGLTWLLLPIIGIVGAGLALLLAQSLLACCLLVRRDLWMNFDSPPAALARALQRLWSTVVAAGRGLVTVLRLTPVLERASAIVRAPLTHAVSQHPPGLPALSQRLNACTSTNVEMITTTTDDANNGQLVTLPAAQFSSDPVGTPRLDSTPC